MVNTLPLPPHANLADEWRAGSHWDETPLGPSAEWPQELATLVDVIRNSEQPMFVAWGPRQILLYNATYGEILADRHPAAFGRPILEVWHDIRSDLVPIIEAAYAGQPVHMQDLVLYIERQGRREEAHFAFSYTPIRDGAGQVQGFFCACVETTDRVLAGRGWLAERDRLAHMFEQAPGIVAATAGPDHVITLANASFRQLYGGRDFVGRSVAEAIPEVAEQGFVALLDEVYRTGVPFRGEGVPIELVPVPGGEREEHIMDFVYQPMRDAAGAVTGIFAQGTDITEQKRTERELRRLNETLEQRVAEELAARAHTEAALRQSQKMEAIGQLTGGVAHDFNNLLTIITSSVGLLRRENLPEEKRRHYIDAIAQTADRAARLTAQLLAFARRQALKPTVFDAGERIVTVANMLRSVVGGSIELITEAGCDNCFVQADATQFETALVNMVVNARDAMDGDGRLAISVKSTDWVPEVRGHRPARGDFVAVRVTDSGHGIAPEHLAQIFEPFFTTKDVGKGTGLGLSQVYGFAKQSGGEVNVESEVGGGTTFTMYLPRVAAPARTCQPEQPEQTTKPMRGHVLVVEDNEQVGSFATQILEDLGFETSWAANSAAALGLIEQDPHGFACVFSDVVMPGISGVDLAREVRARWPYIPVVLTSGYSHALAAEDCGFELLQKPYSVERLTRVLEKSLRMQEEPV